MNWKKIGKHIFLAPLYAFVIAAFGGMIYALGMMLSEVFIFILSDWVNPFIAIGVVWGIAIVTYLMYKAGLFDE